MPVRMWRNGNIIHCCDALNSEINKRCGQKQKTNKKQWKELQFQPYSRLHVEQHFVLPAPPASSLLPPGWAQPASTSHPLPTCPPRTCSTWLEAAGADRELSGSPQGSCPSDPAARGQVHPRDGLHISQSSGQILLFLGRFRRPLPSSVQLRGPHGGWASQGLGPVTPAG